MCAFDLWRVLFADDRLFRGHISLVGAPAIRIKPRDTKGLQQVLKFEKDCILAPPKDIGSHGATAVINRMPQPPRFRFLPHVTPHLIKLGRHAVALCHFVGAPDGDLDVLWGEVLQHCMIHVREIRFLFFNSFRTVVGLTCNTRAVSRMPLFLF